MPTEPLAVTRATTSATRRTSTDAGPTPSRPLVAGPRLTAVLLVLAALGEVTEQVVSPLGRSSGTAADLAAIAARPAAYTASVVVGTLSTLLLLLGSLGLLEHCRWRAPLWSRTGAWLAVVSLACFVGVRAVQAVELQLATSGLPSAQAAGLLDGAFSAPLGLLVLLPFVGGTFVGLVAIGVACWRSGLPRPAAVLLMVFPVADQAAGHLPVGPVASHLVLLVALAWIAAALWRRGPTA